MLPFHYSHTASNPIPIPRHPPSSSVAKPSHRPLLPLSAAAPPPKDPVLFPPTPPPNAVGELDEAESAATSLVKPGAVIAVGIETADVMLANW